MTPAEMRQAKTNLHKVIVEEVLSNGGSLEEDVEMYKYIIELATNEIIYNCLKK